MRGEPKSAQDGLKKLLAIGLVLLFIGVLFAAWNLVQDRSLAGPLGTLTGGTLVVLLSLFLYRTRAGSKRDRGGPAAS